MQKYRLTYDPGTGELTTWVKTAEELLMPNGPDESLLEWMLRTCDERGLPITLETFEDVPGEWVPYSRTRPCQAPDCGSPGHSEFQHWGGDRGARSGQG